MPGENDRALTPAEKRVLEMFAACEDYFNRRVATVTLVVTDDQVRVFREIGCEAIEYKKDKDAAGNNRWDMRLTTATYFKYAEGIARRLGMKLFTDGSLVTFDGMPIGNDYLRQFNYLKVNGNAS